MKYFLIATLFLFGSIGAIGFLKKGRLLKVEKTLETEEIVLGTLEEPVFLKNSKEEDESYKVDRMNQLFALDSSALPIVETVSFTSRVPWLKSRPAWIADYASHFQTSRHFIARSLNKKADYFTQKVRPGDRFNVLKKDKDLQFRLLVDLSKSRMWFYYLDGKEKVLLKTYPVGLGKRDAHKESGFLTPVGKYALGEKIAIYKPGIKGFFQDEKVEMIRVFGTRWLPFEKEVEGCSEPAKGLGIHGVPWVSTSDGKLLEDLSRLNSYDSDGCIRMASEDIEEIFSIVITKPTVVEIVKEFHP